MGSNQREAAFTAFVRRVEPGLRRALVATYGPMRGREAAAEALGYAWEHWERIGSMDNPVGYLYRVGQSRTRRRLHRAVFERSPADDPWVEPRLAGSVARLPLRQRQAVLLVYSAAMTHTEAARLLGITPATLERHLERGLSSLRRALGVGAP